MFEHLEPFKIVIVTGCHRSGTTIAAEMIARDTGKKIIREEVFKQVYDQLFLAELVPDDRVIQAPSMTNLVHDLEHYKEGVNMKTTAVVFMWRAIKEIIDSENDTYWEDGRKAGFNGTHIRQISTYTNVTGKHPAYLKQRAWLQYQRDRIPHAFTVPYYSLRKHPMWRDDHKKFTLRQTA